MQNDPDYDWEYVVDDPLLGEVSCDNRQHALEYASKVKGEAYVVTWSNGEPISREKL